MAAIVNQQVSISIGDEEIKNVIYEEDEEEEVTSRPKTVSFSRFGNPGLKLDSEGYEFEIIGNNFLSGLSALRSRTKVVDVYKCCDLESSHARKDAFRVHTEAVARRRGGDANVRMGWYGGSREHIGGIVAHGFTSPVGGGLCLSAVKHAVDVAMGAEVDENGMRHALLCRVILGKQEEIKVGSNQCYPSSMEFDTGVDSLNEPRKYIVWNAYCNAYILPIYVISFKIEPLSQGLGGMRDIVAGRIRPTSAWVKFSNLAMLLGRILPPSQMAQIKKYYKDFCEKKIGRHQMITKLRLIAGDELLAATIKQFKARA